MRKVFAVSWLNFRQGIREKLFYGAILFFVAFLAFCILMGKLSVGESEKVLRNAGLAGIELSALALVIFSLIFSFYKEKDARILEIYLSCFGRLEYISGKFIGYLLILFFYLALAGLGYALILFLHQAFTWQIIPGIYFLFLKLSIITGFAFIFACLFSSALIALLCSLFLYFTSEAAYSALEIILQGKNQLQALFFKYLYHCLPNMDKLDIKTLVAHRQLPTLSFFLASSLYACAYLICLWIIMQYIFLRKEY